jgi:hypothetical protein
MARTETERELNQPGWHRAQAAEHRHQADALGRAGYRDQAARHLLEARLHELKAAACSAVSMAA